MQVGDKSLELSSYKKPQDNDYSNIKNIVLQNNFTNSHLNTIGLELSHMKKKKIHSQIITYSSSTITYTYSSSSSSKILETKKLHVFKPFQISKASKKEFRNDKIEFLHAIQNQLSRLNKSHGSYWRHLTFAKSSQISLRLEFMGQP